MTDRNDGCCNREALLKKIGNMEQLAYARPCTLTEGRAGGLKCIEVSTGSGLDFTVLESKCMDIYNLKYKGMNMSFIAKPGIGAPEYFNPHGSEFFRHFQGGMLYTCGLSNIGVACEDEGEAFNFHGRISQTPAEKVAIHAGWENDIYGIEIRGEIREAAHYKENLVLKRTISAQYDSKRIQIRDRVENQGFRDEPVMLLYHFNLGYPLLDESARVVVPNRVTTPRTEIAREGLSEFSRISGPVEGFQEHVFYHRNAADGDGKSYAALINDGRKLGLYIKYDVHQLPILAQWKSMAPGDYALGLEAGNHLLEGRGSERQKGTLIHLSPLETLDFDLEVGILEGDAEIDGFEEMLSRLKCTV